MQEKWRSIINTAISGNTAKQFLDIGITVLDIIDKIIKKLDDAGVALPVIAGAISGLFQSLKFSRSGGFEALINQERRLKAEALSTTTALEGQATATRQASSATMIGGTNPGFFATIKEGFQASYLGKSWNVIKGIGTSFKEARQSSGVFASGLTAVRSALAGVEAKALGTKIALGAMNLAMSVVNMGVGMLVSWGIGKVIQHFTDEANRLNDALEKNAENITNLNNKVNSSTKAKTNLSNIRDEYKKLYDTVDKTSAQQERFKELQQQIIDICGEDIVLG